MGRLANKMFTLKLSQFILFSIQNIGMFLLLFYRKRELGNKQVETNGRSAFVYKTK